MGIKGKTTRWLYWHVKSAKNEIIQPQRIKKHLKKEWNSANTARDAKDTQLIKKPSKFKLRP